MSGGLLDCVLQTAGKSGKNDDPSLKDLMLWLSKAVNSSCCTEDAHWSKVEIQLFASGSEYTKIIQ